MLTTRSGRGRLFRSAPRRRGPHGWFSAAAWYAMIHQRHIIEHATRPKRSAEFAIAARRHGAANPNAQLRKPITMDDYLASPCRSSRCTVTTAVLVVRRGGAVVIMSAQGRKTCAYLRQFPFSDSAREYIR